MGSHVSTPDETGKKCFWNSKGRKSIVFSVFFSKIESYDSLR